MSVKELPENIRSLIRSGIAISDISQCVTELVYNALDASATRIGVRIDFSNYQLQVVDDGIGLNKDELSVVGIRYMTSKCHTLEDLNGNLKYYGFRGEALASISKMCKTVVIFSKPEGEDKTYCKILKPDDEYNQDVSEANIERPSHGTTFVVTDFFSNMPVRQKRLQPALEMEQIRTRLQAIALVHPQVSFSLRNDMTKSILLHTKKCEDIIQNFQQIFELNVGLIPITVTEGLYKIYGYISRESSKSKKYQLLYINKRLIQRTELHKFINRTLKKSFYLRNIYTEKDINVSKNWGFSDSPEIKNYAVFVINIECPYCVYNICLDPKKEVIEFKDEILVFNCVQKWLDNFLELERSLHFVDEPNTNVHEKEIENKSQKNVELKETPPLIESPLITPRNIPRTVTKHVAHSEHILTECEVDRSPFGERNCITFLESNKKTIMPIVFKDFYESNLSSLKNCAEVWNKRRLFNLKVTPRNEKLKCEHVSVKEIRDNKRRYATEKAGIQMNYSGGVCKNKKLKNEKTNMKLKYQKGLTNSSEIADSSNSTTKAESKINELKKFKSNDLTSVKENFDIKQLVTFKEGKLSGKRIIRKTSHSISVQTDFKENCNNKIAHENIKLKNDKENEILEQKNIITEESHQSLSRVRNIVPLESSNSNTIKSFTLDGSQVQSQQAFNNISLFKNDNCLIQPPKLKFEAVHVVTEPEICCNNIDLTEEDKYFPEEILKIQSQLESLKLHESCSVSDVMEVGSKVLTSNNSLNSDMLLQAENPLTDAEQPNSSNIKCNEIKNTQKYKTEKNLGSLFDLNVVYVASKEKNRRKMLEIFTNNDVIKNTPADIRSTDSIPESDSTNPNELINLSDIKTLAECIQDLSPHKRKHSEDYNSKKKTKIHNPETLTKDLNMNKKSGLLENAEITKENIYGQTSKEMNKDMSTCWKKHILPCGKCIYVHCATGMSSYVSPKEDVGYDIETRQWFWPKGMSPIQEAMKTDKIKFNLSSDEKKEVQNVIEDNEYDLYSVKWREFPFKDDNFLLKFDSQRSCNTKGIKCALPDLESFAITTEDLQKTNIIGLLDKKFIAATIQCTEKYMIVLFDQHAVDERIRYEKLYNDYRNSDGCFYSTTINPPLVLPYSKNKIEVIKHFLKSFEGVGLTLEVNESTVSVHAIPTCLKIRSEKETREQANTTLTENIEKLIFEGLDAVIKTRGSSLSTSQVLDSIISYEACRGAIKFGDTISVMAAQAMIKQLARCRFPFQCAHGRPVLSPVFNFAV